MAIGICKNCRKEKKDIAESGKSEGLCHQCYKKLLWKPKLINCPRCKRIKPYQGRGLCMGCYNSVYQINNVLAGQRKKLYNIDNLTYKEITKACILCGFDKVVDLHHLDHDHNNIYRDNLVGLCPNHHRMLHHRNHKREIHLKLKEMGFKVPELYADDSVFKQNK